MVKQSTARASSLSRRQQTFSETDIRNLLYEAVESLRDQSIKKVPAGKFIWDYNNPELDAAVDRAAKQFGSEFWTLLNGVDAYFERRRRKYREATTAGYSAARSRWGV